MLNTALNEHHMNKYVVLERLPHSFSKGLFILPIHALHLTSLGLPGCDGGGVLRRGGGCDVPLPLLRPRCLCLYRHAVCHSQGVETNRLQVSLFSGLSFRLCALVLRSSLSLDAV